MYRTILRLFFRTAFLLAVTTTLSFGQETLEDNKVCLDPIVGRGVVIDHEHTFKFDLNGADLTDGNLTDYGILTLEDGAALSIEDSLHYYPAGSEAGFVVSPIGGPISWDVRWSFEVKTYRNGEILEAGSPVTVRPLALGSDKYILSFKTTRDFDLVKIYYGGGVIEGLVKLKVYYAFECPPACLETCENPALDTDRDGYADCYDKCPTGSDAQDADGDGTPDACDPTNDCCPATVCVPVTIRRVR